MRGNQGRRCSRAFCAICLAAFSLLTSSCEEHSRLNREIAEVRGELDSVQKSIGEAENEQAKYTKEDLELRAAVPLRWGPEMTKRKAEAMKAELDGLRKNKAVLEVTLKEFKADFESYQRKYH
jgi:chromosome segregation ATPase